MQSRVEHQESTKRRQVKLTISQKRMKTKPNSKLLPESAPPLLLGIPVLLDHRARHVEDQVRVQAHAVVGQEARAARALGLSLVIDDAGRALVASAGCTAAALGLAHVDAVGRAHRGAAAGAAHDAEAGCERLWGLGRRGGSRELGFDLEG
ncbi:hypothetical protein BS50DRAFT_122335 [Corynespora cassiicola Philippines]|uniref:Uncharacterized protein n=1 Tax=Corynespora cassiicola Philippines TaxID=1448308 RepID=A0A2T2NAW5_CORCC|nr:hypothetical protein BS50DRAFT_122335 [Corynespora cassiicola Philippines]